MKKFSKIVIESSNTNFNVELNRKIDSIFNMAMQINSGK